MKTIFADTNLFDILPVPAFVSDAKGSLTSCNKAAFELFDEKPLLGSDNWFSSWKMYHIDGTRIDAAQTPMHKALAQGEPVINEEVVIEFPEGNYRNFLVFSNPVTDENGNVTGGSHSFIDITGQKSGETKQAILAAIIESSEDAIISKSLKGVINSWNRAAEHLFGYTEKEAIGRHITMLIPEDRLDEETHIIGKVMKGEVVEHFETIRLTKYGREIPISLTVSPVKDRTGRVIGASKIARNISRQKEAEARLQQYAEDLEVLNSFSKAVSEKMDVQEILQKVTDVTTQLTGAAFGAFFYNVVNASGEAYMLYTLSGAAREDFEKLGQPRKTAMLAPTFEGKGAIRLDDVTQHPDYGKNAPNGGMPCGHLPVKSYMAVPVVSKSGQVIGGLFYGHPEPARFKKEHENMVGSFAGHAAIALDNAKLYEEIQQLNSKKDEFIGLASHELKTPVTSIKGYLQIIEKNPSNQDRNKHFVNKALQQINKLSGLVSDLLDVSKIETGKLPFEFTEFDIAALLDDVVELTRYANTSHQIIKSYDGGQVMVCADRLRIEQVVINLINNAVRYSPKADKVIVSITTADNKVKVSVQDFGIGVSPEHQKNIFKRFYRVDDLAAHMSGLGIGLYICHEIVARHGGEFLVQSEVGEGSTFSFEIPLSR